MSEKSFQIEKYSIEGQRTWDSVVSRSKNGNFLHLRNYLDYHAHRFEDHSVMVHSSGKPIAVFPANRAGDEVVSHGGITYGGLIYGSGLHASDVLGIMEALAEYYRSIGVRQLVYKAIPHIYHRYPAEEDLYALFRLGAVRCRCDISSVIALENKLKLSDSRKCTIRKSASLGVEIREGDFFASYHALLCQVLARLGSTPVHSLEELQLLKGRFPDQIRLFGAFYRDELLAGSIIYDFGHLAHTQYMASSATGKEIGALDFLLSQLIDGVFCSRRYFSLGTSTLNQGRELNEGLIFQKEGFGARGVVYDFFRLDL